jgi:PAS domain S-box-containing protein
MTDDKDTTLTKSKKTIQALLNATTDMVYLIDTKGTVLAINDKAAKRFGKSVEEIINTKIFDYLSPDVAKSRKAWADEVCDKKERICFEDEREGKTFEVSVYPILDNHGNVVEIAVYAHETTVRKHAEEGLEQKIREMETFINNIPHMAWLKDSDSNFLLANQAFADVVGMSPEYLKSNTCAVCFGEEAAKKFKEDDRKVMEGKEQLILEESITDKDGKKKHLETTKSPIFNSTGDVVGTVGVAIDITERKWVEDELRKYRNQLHELVEERTSELKQEITERNKAEEELRKSKEQYMEISKLLVTNSWT